MRQEPRRSSVDCLEVDPGMLDAMHGLIRALQEQGELDAAIAVAQRLLQLDPMRFWPTPASPSCINTRA